jgi:hypothetical protein
LGGGERLESEGTFHFVVKHVKDGERPGGKAAEGFMVDLQVLEGEHEGKSIQLFLQDGQASHNDGGAFCRRRQCAYLVASNGIEISALSAPFSFEPEATEGQQIIARMKLGKATDQGNRYLDFGGLEIYHVDDPRTEKVAKSAEALKLLPKELRRPAEYFAPILPGGGGSKSSKPAAKAPELDLDGL